MSVNCSAASCLDDCKSAVQYQARRPALAIVWDGNAWSTTGRRSPDCSYQHCETVVNAV